MEFETIDVAKLETLNLALTNYFAHSLPNGKLYKNTINSLATFMAPYVSAVGASGYVEVAGNVLPNPVITNGYSLIAAGTYTQTGESNIVATGTINIVTWNGTTWSLTKEINVDLSDYATKESVQNLIDYISFDESGNLIVTDENGNISLKITTEGLTQVIKLQADDLITNKLNGLSPSGVPFVFGSPTEILGVVSDGQSNSTWSGADHNAITTTQKYDAVTSKGGINIYQADDYSDFIPLVEKSGTDAGETVLSATLEKFTEEVQNKNFIDFNKKGFRFFGFVSGVGGQGIAKLSKNAPEGWYSAMMSAISKTNNLCKSKGLSFSMAFLEWTQGEDDSASNRSYSYYYNLLNQLIIDFNSDTKSLLGNNQKNSIVFVGPQLAWHDNAVQDLDRIGKAQLDMGLKNPLYICSTPTYMLKIDITDQVHYIPSNKRILGAYAGRAAHQTIVSGKKFLPLHPISYNIQPNDLGGYTVKITYYVPFPPLKFDVSVFPNSGDYGFKVYANSVPDPLVLSNIRIIPSENAVYIDVPVNPEGGVVMYARDNNYGYINNPDGVSIYFYDRGNLRDSQGDIDIFDGFPMHNWAVCSHDYI